MTERIELSKMPQFTADDMEKRFDEVVQFVTEGKGPAIISDENGKSMVALSWDQYFDMFGDLYSEEELKTLNEACRACKDE